jgi:hypothetical protein
VTSTGNGRCFKKGFTMYSKCYCKASVTEALTLKGVQTLHPLYEILCMRPLGFFNLPNPSSCIMDLGFTQPQTEMSTRNLPRLSNAAGAYE